MKRVLIIDDNPDFLHMAARTLEKRGFAAVPVDCSGAARAALAGGGIDAVLLDVVLGRENGWEVLRQLHESSPVPILLMSGGNVDEDMRIDAAELGARGVIQKPFDWDGVVETLSQVTR